jgi:DNA-binding MarR family transcriptional regulator
MISIAYPVGMANRQDVRPQLSERLTYLFKRALVDLEHLHAEQLALVGVSGRALGVLLLLDGRDPESQQEVAGRLGVDRTTMVVLLDGLEDKGLVTRRADVGDRRRNVLELTGDGHKTLARALRASDEANGSSSRNSTTAESKQLRTLLTRLALNRSRALVTRRSA